MQFSKSMLYTFIGAGLWNTILAAIGYSLASVVRPEELDATVAMYESPIKIAMVVIGIAIVAYLIWKGRK